MTFFLMFVMSVFIVYLLFAEADVYAKKQNQNSYRFDINFHMFNGYIREYDLMILIHYSSNSFIFHAVKNEFNFLLFIYRFLQ